MKSVPLRFLARKKDGKFSVLQIVVSVEDNETFVLLRPGPLGFSIWCTDYKDVSKHEHSERFVDPSKVFYTRYIEGRVIILISEQAFGEGGWDLEYINPIL